MTPPPRLAFETFGDEQRPPVLLVHGFMSCNAQWAVNRQALGRSFHLVQVELWGHGRSPLPADAACFSAEGYIEQFETIREELGVSRWSAIGQSYGAGLVMRYAIARPGVIEALVVTNSRSGLGREPLRRRPTTDDEPDGPWDRPGFELRELPFHPIHARRLPDEVKAEMVASADAMSIDAVRRGGSLGAQLNCARRLDELAMPLLLVNGLYEKAFQNDVDWLRQRYAQLEVADLEGGHSVNIEAASEFERVVGDFLRRARRTLQAEGTQPTR